MTWASVQKLWQIYQSACGTNPWTCSGDEHGSFLTARWSAVKFCEVLNKAVLMDGLPVRIHLRVFRSAGLPQIAHTIRMGGIAAHAKDYSAGLSSACSLSFSAASI